MADTAQDIIKDALRDLGRFGKGESLDDDDSERGLQASKDLLDAWSIEKLIVFATTTISQALTAGKSSYTIGASGADITATRPLNIEVAVIRDAGGVDHPMRVIAFLDYERIQTKTVQSDLPLRIAFNPGFPNGTLHLYPAPASANTLRADVVTQLVQLTAQATVFSMPPGFRRAVRKNLALELAPMFGVTPGPWLIKQAIESKAMVKRNNIQNRELMARYDQILLAMGRGGGYNINTDY